MKGLPKSRTLRLGTAIYAISSAGLTTLAVEILSPPLGVLPIGLIFGGLFIAFWAMWRWVFLERMDQLNKIIPVSSKELRRRRKQFYDDLSQQ